MSRISDHLDGQPEDRWFSRIARQMQCSPWWRTVPKHEPQAPVSGEIESRK